MLTKIAGLLASAKGAAAATLIAGSAVTGGTVATVPEAREAVVETVGSTTTGLGSAVAAIAQAANARRAADTSCGKPEVVAQRNEADRQLRDAFQDDHKTLTQLRGGKDSDPQKVNTVVKKATDDLRAVLTVALTDVARETQGRTGLVAKANASASPSSSPSASPSASAGVACAEPSGKPADVTLNTALSAIVVKATSDMDAIVAKATTDAAAIPAAERGKPSGDPARGNSNDGKKNDDKKSDAPKGPPSERPGGKPSTPPGRP